jgi:hypothetical protein
VKGLFITPLAEVDMKQAYDWYELNSVGLGERFLRYLKSKLVLIQKDPG